MCVAPDRLFLTHTDIGNVGASRFAIAMLHSVVTKVINLVSANRRHVLVFLSKAGFQLGHTRRTDISAGESVNRHENK